MNCDCGNKFTKIKGDLHFYKPELGNYTVNKIHYNKCFSCGKILFGLTTARKIQDAEEFIIQKQNAPTLIANKE